MPTYRILAPAPPSRLLRLPLEIRLKIYTYIDTPRQLDYLYLDRPQLPSSLRQIRRYAPSTSPDPATAPAPIRSSQDRDMRTTLLLNRQINAEFRRFITENALHVFKLDRVEMAREVHCIGSVRSAIIILVVSNETRGALISGLIGFIAALEQVRQLTLRVRLTMNWEAPSEGDLDTDIVVEAVRKGLLGKLPLLDELVFEFAFGWRGEASTFVRVRRGCGGVALEL